MRQFFAVFLCVVSSLVGAATPDKAADALATAVQDIQADVVFMRHAIAPGYGDPEIFQIGDCSTQRNLDAQGRAQAQQTGAALRRSAAQFSEILSSEWCRCTETAALLDLGEWRTFAGLNSFFQGHADEAATLLALRQRLQSRSPGLTLMVTHQVVISRITGLTVGSGEMVAYNTLTQQAKRVRLS